MKMKEDKRGDKISEIEHYLEELESIFPLNFEDYKHDFKIKSICERYFEKIVEAVVDLAFIVIKEKKLKIPEDDENSFDILKDEKIISDALAKKLIDAKSMRNIIAHEYGKIDDEMVFHAVIEELIPDVLEFIKCVKRLK